MGYLHTEDNHIRWASEPQRPTGEVSNFRMPRISTPDIGPGMPRINR
jgi:hypothetical protein